MRLDWLKNRKNPWLVAVSVLLFLALGWLLYAKGPLGPTKVTVAKAQKQSFNAGVFGIGTVDARLTYSIGPTQAGRVFKVFADQGDKVAAGKVLGEMDPVDLEQKINSAAASVAKSQSALMASEAQVRDAASRNQLARTSASRYNSLFKSNAISQETADVKNNEANAAQSTYEAALASTESARGEVTRATAEYAALISQRNNLQLVSPVDGLVVSRDAEPGATVVAGQSVFRLVDPSTVWIRTRIDQARFHGISVGQPAGIVLRSRPDKRLPGKVARLEVQADSVTEERFVDVVFNEAPGALPLGELAEVTIDFPEISDAVVVPAAAIKKQGKQSGVWMVESGRLRFQPIDIGAQSLDGKVQILKGLSPEDTVVVYSQQLLSEGMKVRVEKQP
ncbi:MAG TPA: efflux RND transporter periplasmic adaptor subunit [Negativicutes bacterium]|nr:efflux RND transporter periplasmic adaptor subunit [Negativicutes bacterium]